jgi:hypothetical protein
LDLVERYWLGEARQALTFAIGSFRGLAAGCPGRRVHPARRVRKLEQVHFFSDDGLANYRGAHDRGTRCCRADYRLSRSCRAAIK